MNGFTKADIKKRLPLWEALGNLYLDTESDAFVPLVVKAAREGGFSLKEVEHILKWEIRPALYFNYLDVAGEWAGWDNDWLVERIIETTGKHADRLLLGETRFMPDEWPFIQAAMTPS